MISDEQIAHETPCQCNACKASRLRAQQPTRDDLLLRAAISLDSARRDLMRAARMLDEAHSPAVHETRLSLCQVDDARTKMVEAA